MLTMLTTYHSFLKFEGITRSHFAALIVKKADSTTWLSAWIV